MSDIQSLINAELARGPKQPLIGTLASVDADGAARARSVVVRGFDDAADAIWLSTHLHAHKSRQLLRSPEADLVLWLPRKNIQLRLLCSWRLIDAGIAARNAPMGQLRNTVWLETSPATRGMFAWPEPASPYDRKARGTPLPDDPNTPPPTFALLYGTLELVDALHIKRPVHIRIVHEKNRTKWLSHRINP